MFDAIKKILASAREQHTRTFEELQQKRRDLEQLRSTPHARSEIIAATEAAIADVWAEAFAPIRERAQQLLLDGVYSEGCRIQAPGAFPLDEARNPAISDAMLLTMLAEPLRQLVRDALADLPNGITAERRASETKRITAEIQTLEAKVKQQQAEAEAAGVTL